MPMYTKWVLALMLGLGSAWAQQTTLYRGFAEVQQPINLPNGAWVWQPGTNLWNSLVAGTLRLQGVSELSRQVQTKAAPAVLSAYVGKKIAFFWEGKWNEATVVDAGLPLFLFEGRYLSSLPGVVTYPDPSGFGKTPELSITFRYQGQGAATLGYLTRGLSWSLRYSLDIARNPDGSPVGELVGWATLNNGLEQTLNLGRIELVAGSVPLLEGGLAQAQAQAPLQRSFMTADTAAAAPSAEFVGEASGVYRYRLPGEWVLESGSTEVPFLRSRIAPVFYWRYSAGFSGASEMRFERGYRFEAPENLAGGLVSLRDGGVFVGQSSFSDLGKGNEARLSLGADPDGRADRRVENLGQGRYRVTMTLRNPKTYPIEVEISEAFDSRSTLDFPSATRTPEGYRLRIALRPGEVRALSYAVTIPTR